MKRRADVSASAAVRRAAVRNGGDVLFDYSAALDGFAARLPAPALEAVEANPNVAYVEANRTVTAFGDQYDPPWGLDRIDQRGRSLNRTYHYDQRGTGVDAYVIDSGIRITHSQFGGRATDGFDAVDGLPAADCNGHGTHVAGTIGSSKYGVAKAVNLIAVRVLDCNGDGSFAGVIAGIDFVTQAHQPGEPAVANLSLGGGLDPAVNAAVTNLIADGVTVVVAAGNDTKDACEVSPASTAGALTVGATTYEDRIADYSNWGTCLDLFAPGSQVLSTRHNSDTALHVENGTSMASPHVAGVVATYLQNHEGATPDEVATAVLGAANVDKVKGALQGSPNRLLFSRLGPTSSSPPPPTATNLVPQPGFESGPGRWKGTEWSIDCDDGSPLARAGSCHAWLGGYGDDRTTNIGQSGIQVPPASSKKLSFYVHVQSNEAPGTGVFDKLFVRIVANGTTTPVLTLDNEDEGLGYVRYAFPLGAFAGQSIEIRFVANEDFAAATSFFIDDVAVK